MSELLHPRQKADWIYDPDNWEFTHEVQDADDLAYDNIPDGCLQTYRLIKAAGSITAAMIDGKVRWFETEDEARAALNQGGQS